MITKEYLEAELSSLKTQHDNAVVVQHQAMGAMLLIESLLAQLVTTAVTTEAN